MIKSLENRIHEKRLEELELFSPGKKKICSHSVKSHYPISIYSNEGII